MSSVFLLLLTHTNTSTLVSGWLHAAGDESPTRNQQKLSLKLFIWSSVTRRKEKSPSYSNFLWSCCKPIEWWDTSFLFGRRKPSWNKISLSGPSSSLWRSVKEKYTIESLYTIHIHLIPSLNIAGVVRVLSCSNIPTGIIPSLQLLSEFIYRPFIQSTRERRWWSHHKRIEIRSLSLSLLYKNVIRISLLSCL